MTAYPEQIGVRLPAGWRERVQTLARADGRSVGGYLRNLIRKALESAARAERRRRAGK